MDGIDAIAKIKASRLPLHFERARIITKNGPEWISTVDRAVTFITRTTERTEKIVALPYDLLYVFLAGRTQGIYQSSLLEFNRITPRQEEMFIEQIEKNRVELILVSNRIKSGEVGIGSFGETHCRILARYIDEHFAEAARFGEWDTEPGWTSNHGVKILKRNKN